MASNRNDLSITDDNKLVNVNQVSDDEDEDKDEDDIETETRTYDIVTERQKAVVITGSSNIQVNFLGDVNLGQPKDCLEVEQCKSDYQLNLTIDRVKERLIKIYKDLKLPITSWLGHVQHELLIKDYFVPLELRGTKEIIIPLNEIFIEKETMKEIKQIYIEAPPGFGKTTLTYKLATDWMTNEEYIKKFDLAFLVVLKYLRGISVKTMLSELAEHEDEDELWELINNEKTLIILDGLDEIGDKAKCKINDLQFQGTVVITGRTGSYNLDSRNTLEHYKGLEKSNRIMGRFITISGIGRKNRVDFLYKFFHDSKNWEIIKNKIDKLTNSLDELFKSSLMLILLAYVLNEKLELNIENDSVLLYKTHLYKHLINILIIRSQTKKNKNIESDFDLFFDEKRNGEMIEVFDKFGSIALKNLENDNLQFKPDAVVEKIYELGFLLKHQSTDKFKTRVHFEGLHLSIIEFTAAISLWLHHKKNEKFTENQLIRIRNLIVNKGEKSLVVPFLCGLIGKNVKELFIELRPHYSFFIDKDISFLLQECEMDDLLGEAISPLISNYLHFYKTPSFEKLQLMKYGLKFQAVKFIITNFDFLKYLPTKLDGVTLYVRCEIHCKFVKVIKTLKCKKLIFSFVDSFTKSDSAYKIILETFNNIDCETKRLDIDCDPKMLLNFLRKKETKITRIDELQFFLSFIYDKNLLSSFEQIFSFFIEHCQVKSFECFNYCYDPLSNIIKSMSKSSFLKSVYIRGIGNNSDLKLIKDICQNVSFDRFTINTVPFQDVSGNFSFYKKKYNNKIYESFFHKKKEWGNECKLTFYPNTLHEISLLKSQVLKSITGLDKVIELKLNYDRGIFWKTIKSCKHIQTITLWFDTTQKLDDFLQELENIEKNIFLKLNLKIEMFLNFFENLVWANKFVSEMLKISLVKTLVVISEHPKNNKKEIDMVSTLKYHWLFTFLQKLICSGAVDTVDIYIRKDLDNLPLDVNCMFSNLDPTKLQCESEGITHCKISRKITKCEC